MAQLRDEIQGLVRSLKSKDQTTQESTIKSELMERCMEVSKKQTHVIVELESELSKTTKQEWANKEAMKQLQADLYSLKQ